MVVPPKTLKMIIFSRKTNPWQTWGMHIWGHLLMSLFFGVRPQRPWFLISFAVNYLMVNYVTIVIMYLCIFWVVFTRCPRRPSQLFLLPPKPQFPRLRCRDQVIIYMIFRLGGSILQYHVFYDPVPGTQQDTRRSQRQMILYSIKLPACTLQASFFMIPTQASSL